MPRTYSQKLGSSVAEVGVLVSGPLRSAIGARIDGRLMEGRSEGWDPCIQYSRRQGPTHDSSSVLYVQGPYSFHRTASLRSMGA